jgi:large subunit ribosomal protein L21
MYAIISTGGKQAKVSEGDVLSVELIKDTGKVSYTPLLIVQDDGSVIADPAKLEKATVSAEVLGESAGPKIDIFKYKNKTGYRRRMGHRQKYTTIKVTGIKAPGGKKKATKDAKGAEAAKATESSKAKKGTKDAKVSGTTEVTEVGDDAENQEA